MESELERQRCGEIKLSHRLLRPAAAAFGPHASINIDELLGAEFLLTSDALDSLMKCQSITYLKFTDPANVG